MFNSFLTALQAVLPMFILIAIGMIVRKLGMIDKEENRRLNKMTFTVFFSALMFNSIYRNGISKVVDYKLVIYGIICVFAVYILTTVFVLRVEKNDRSRGALIQAIYRSNFVIMGFPIAANVCGDAHLAITALMVAVIVPIYNIIAILTLEYYGGGKSNPKNMLVKLAKNPLLDGAALGIITVLLGIKLPIVIENLLDGMSAVATPLALIILGISFEFSQIRDCGRNLIFAVAGRLIIVPAVVLSAAALIGFRGIDFVTLIAIFASPSAIASYTMAESMNSDSVLAGNAVIVSSLLSCLTMFLWIFLFKMLDVF